MLALRGVDRDASARSKVQVHLFSYSLFPCQFLGAISWILASRDERDPFGIRRDVPPPFDAIELVGGRPETAIGLTAPVRPIVSRMRAGLAVVGHLVVI